MEQFTDKQLSEMKHCIGYAEHRVRGRKYRKYTAYRNRYAAPCYLASWDDLVSRGFAKVERAPDSQYPLYWLTKTGMDALGEVLGCAILEDD